MATNPAADYGRDIRCVTDADEQFSDATGLDVLYQDLVHRVTCDDVLGPDGDGWGRDCRRLLGMKTTELKKEEAIYAEVLTRDPRVSTATVKLTPITSSKGLADVLFDASGTSSLGPWRFVKPVSELTLADLEP
jgi:hypothetical protein